MIVTDIIELTKAKSRIFLDGEFAFVLYKGEIRLYHIAKGQELALEDYEEIIHTVLPKRAKKRSMMLLQKKDYTEAELRRKLSAGEYPLEAIDEALEYVKNYRYVDDYRYSVSYITCYGSKWSRQKILSNLLTKGVDKKCIQKAFNEVSDKGDMVSEENLIKEILKKKHYDAHSADAKAKRKMYQHLLYKGFSSGAIGKILGEFYSE